MVLNLAEGANEFSPKEKIRFYRMARRSAGECMAALDLADRVLAPHPRTPDAKSLLDEVIAMLTTLILAQDRRRE